MLELLITQAWQWGRGVVSTIDNMLDFGDRRAWFQRTLYEARIVGTCARQVLRPHQRPVPNGKSRPEQAEVLNLW